MADTETLHPAVRHTTVAYRGNEKNYRDGTVLPDWEKPRLRIQVTKPQLARALSIFNLLARKLDAAGFTFGPPGERKFIPIIHTESGQVVACRIQEAVERYRPEKKAEYTWLDRWAYRGTGTLRFLIDEYWPQETRKRFTDGKRQQLDAQVDEMVEACVGCARGKLLHAQEAEVQRRRWEEQERLRREARERQEAEVKKRQAFLATALRWKEAETLREYRAACLAQFEGKGGPSAEDRAWLEWTESVIASHVRLDVRVQREEP